MREAVNLLQRAMTAIQEDYDTTGVDDSTIVIHGVHQFNPITLRAIDELQKYKKVILLFNYQKQYKNVYQTWFDIERSGHEDPNIIYHFACLEDEDVGAVKKAEFPWPLNDDFFEVAQNPVDWKYQVYVKCCNEYKNFKRYALIYGLEFNRAKFKLSYVRRDGDKEREPYYLLKILGLKKEKYASTKKSRRLEDSSQIDITGSRNGNFDAYRHRP